MNLTQDQQKGLDIILERWHQGYHYTTLAGFAGVGKSYLVRHVVEAMGLDPEEDVAFATPTGKAAQVLASMGNKNATTIHRLLYQWFPRNNGKFGKKRYPYLPYKLVVCDEVSMIPKEFITELLRHKECYILFTGDPEQLPPVSSEDANDILDYPHVFLSQIMRQALDSDIIKLSMDIREGKSLNTLNGNDVKILTHNDLTEGMLTWASQVCCATNATRKSLNTQINTLMGYPNDTIVDGQKIICLRNYWDIASFEGEPLVNGTIGFIRNPVEEHKKIANCCGGGYIDIIKANIQLENGDVYQDISLDKQQLLTGKKTIKDWRQESAIKNFYSSNWAIEHGLENPLPIEAEFGWAITTWKAQGSTFDKVLGFEEGHPWDKEEHRKYLYTLVTRPSSKLVLIKKG